MWTRVDSFLVKLKQRQSKAAYKQPVDAWMDERLNSKRMRSSELEDRSHAEMKTYNILHIIYNARNGSIDICDFVIILKPNSAFALSHSVSLGSCTVHTY